MYQFIIYTKLGYIIINLPMYFSEYNIIFSIKQIKKYYL